MFKGKFITIEGGEGSGKSTQINVIKAWLEKHNISYVLTREPGGSPLGEELRKILKNATYDFSEMAELYLFNAGRIEHIEKVIKPNLEKGITVVCDRYYDSTLAYQGVARGLGYEKVKNLCKLAIDGMEPDMTIWLDINPVDAFKRKGGADVGDRLEQTGLNFHEAMKSNALTTESSVNSKISLPSIFTESAISLRRLPLQHGHCTSFI